MTIPGIPGSSYPNTTGIAPQQRTRTEQRPAAPVQAPEPAQVPATRQAGAAAAAPLPAAPPAGTDPVLWSVLNAEERAFFARIGAMGPLTYGRVLSGQMAAATPDVRGGRLDLTV